jgi:hypothetical protein
MEISEFKQMSHNHILGAWADYVGNVHYEYENTEQLYPVDIFEYCPVCGVKLKPVSD